MVLSPSRAMPCFDPEMTPISLIEPVMMLPVTIMPSRRAGDRAAVREAAGEDVVLTSMLE